MGFIGWYWKRFQGCVDGINVALVYFIYYRTVGVLGTSDGLGISRIKHLNCSSTKVLVLN